MKFKNENLNLHLPENVKKTFIHAHSLQDAILLTWFTINTNNDCPNEEIFKKNQYFLYFMGKFVELSVKPDHEIHTESIRSQPLNVWVSKRLNGAFLGI